MMPVEPAAEQQRLRIERLLDGSPSRAVTDHIVAILADVPGGILAALDRYGTKIRFSESEHQQYANSNRVILVEVSRNAVGSVALAYGAKVDDWLKRSIGRAFSHVLVSDMVAAAGGASKHHPGDLAQLAGKGPGIRQSDRLHQCWIAAIARLPPGEKRVTIAELFASGFKDFCTPGLRASLQAKAPEMLRLMTELVETYDINGTARFPQRSRPHFSREAWDESANIIVNREDFSRTRIQKALQRLPLRVIRLLDEHGVRIQFKDPLRTRSGRLYDRVKPERRAGFYDLRARRATVFNLDEGLIVHELGHALDHALLNETAKGSTLKPAYFSYYSLMYPGRSELGDRLIARWTHANQSGARVSRYARESLAEWFAESMKCYFDAGSDHHIRVGRFTGGDGTVETLAHQDPQLFEVFGDIFSRIEHGVDINGLDEIVPVRAVEPERAAGSFHRSFRGKVIGRDHSAESVYVLRKDGDVVRITPCMFGTLADPPVQDEIVTVSIRGDKVYALTQKQTAPHRVATHKGKEAEI